MNEPIYFEPVDISISLEQCRDMDISGVVYDATHTSINLWNKNNEFYRGTLYCDYYNFYRYDEIHNIKQIVSELVKNNKIKSGIDYNIDIDSVYVTIDSEKNMKIYNDEGDLIHNEQFTF